jgi:hypothetical protein
MAAKLTRLTHKIAIQLQLAAENCTICSPRSRRPVQKLLDTPSYVIFWKTKRQEKYSETGEAISVNEKRDSQCYPNNNRELSERCGARLDTDHRWEKDNLSYQF